MVALTVTGEWYHQGTEDTVCSGWSRSLNRSVGCIVSPANTFFCPNSYVARSQDNCDHSCLDPLARTACGVLSYFELLLGFPQRVLDAARDTSIP